MGVDYIVAPYEADAQLAYLVKIGYADMVYTEDSDLVALGCPKVIFKLDNDGKCVEINLSDLPKVRELDFSLFNHDKFLHYCILSGCDYFKIKGIGYKKAYQLIREMGDYVKCIKQLKQNPKFYNNLPTGAEEMFEKAFLTFKFQVVYCTKEKKMKYMNDIENTIYTSIHKHNLSFLGKYILLI
jgi:exonuclease-1